MPFHWNWRQVQAWKFQCRYGSFCTRDKCQFKHDAHGETFYCGKLDYQDDQCKFKTKVEKRYKNHLITGHGEEGSLKCDSCDFETRERENMKDHVTCVHQEPFEICKDMCSDRLYNENTFECCECGKRKCIIDDRGDSKRGNKFYCIGCDPA